MKSSVYDTSESGLEPAPRPQGKPYRTVMDARSVSMLGLGMVVGAVIGAGIALLVAPRSGEDARSFIGRKVRHLRGETGVWDRLGREFRRAAAAKRREMKLKAARRIVEVGSPDPPVV